MRVKKVRGLKRKIKNMLKRIEQETTNFPDDFYNGYWHLHLPVAESFISSSKTPFAIKRICIQALLDRVEHLIKIKPYSNERFRILAAIYLSDLWNSQIIVFSGDRHFKGFFCRDRDDQKWLSLPMERNIINEWNVSISDSMDCLRIMEKIMEEDGELFENEIWFIGEWK